MLDFLFGAKKTPRSIAIVDRALPIVAGPKETILEAALREGMRFPNDCRVGGCGTCKCRLVEGKVHERTDKAYVLSREELAAGYVLACQSVPKTDVRIALDGRAQALPSHPVVRTEGVIATRRMLTRDIVELVVEVRDAVVYTAGQYARITLPGLPGESRAYSFARAPGSGRELVFYVREVPGGAVSPSLVHGRGADRVLVEGPFGDFHLREGVAPVFALAGGSGLAPVRAILEDLVRQKVARDVTLLFGARTQDDLYELDALAALGRSSLASFRILPVLSHEPAASGFRGARGLVTEHIAAHLDPRSDAYLCGPPAMIDAAIDVLGRHGVRRERIAFDAFTDKSTAPKATALEGNP